RLTSNCQSARNANILARWTSPKYNASGDMQTRGPFIKAESGQALLEMAVVLPFLLILVFNAINFGYFFIVAINITAAPRSAVEYSIMGSSTPAGDLDGLPKATPANSTSATVAALAYQDLQGALATYAASAT